MRRELVTGGRVQGAAHSCLVEEVAHTVHVQGLETLDGLRGVSEGGQTSLTHLDLHRQSSDSGGLTASHTRHIDDLGRLVGEDDVAGVKVAETEALVVQELQCLEDLPANCPDIIELERLVPAGAAVLPQVLLLRLCSVQDVP